MGTGWGPRPAAAAGPDTGAEDPPPGTAQKNATAPKKEIHVAGILSGYITVNLSSAELGHAALVGLQPGQVPFLGDDPTLTAKATFAFDSRTNTFSMSAEIRYEDECVLVILQAAGANKCGAGQVMTVMGTLTLKPACKAEGFGKVSGLRHCGDGDGAAGYSLTAEVNYINYTISEDMSLEVTDSRVQLLVGAGLPDDVLARWKPDAGYAAPAPDGEEEEALQRGSVTPAELGAAAPLRRRARLAAWPDPMHLPA